MHLEDLFEKREKSQLVLIGTLMEQTSEANLKDILSKTGLSRTTLIKYIDDLNDLAQESGFELAIFLNSDRLDLRLGAQVTKEELIQLLLPFSLKIQILHYLYAKEEFTVQKLSQELLISEATLHRQLAALNTLLEEFGVSIKNGRLRGEEHQIRYFYYQLYWLTIPKKEMAERFAFPQYQPMIEATKQVWSIEMPTTNEFKLALWFSITKKRIGLKKKYFKGLKQQMRVYQTHRFFQQVRQQMLRYLSRYALEVEEEEAMCQFIFITTMSILSPYVMERKLGYGGPVSEATTKGLRVIRSIVPLEENLSEQGMYTLNQILGQLYFFKGALIDHAYRLDQDLAVIGGSMALDHEDLAQAMIDEVVVEVYGFHPKQYGDLLVKARWRIMEVLSYVIYQAPRQLVIGVDLSGSQTKRLPVLSVLRQQLEVSRLVILEPWNSNDDYDFVISNVYNETYRMPTYYLKGAPNAYDIQQLEETINDCLVGKSP